MATDRNPVFRIALFSAGAVVIVVFGLLVVNLVDHFRSRPTSSPVAAQVVHVKALTPSSIRITATLRLKGTTSAQVNCLVAVVEPANPLAYQSIVPVHLLAGQTQTLIVDRTLLHPQAATVTPSNVSLVCT